MENIAELFRRYQHSYDLLHLPIVVESSPPVTPKVQGPSPKRHSAPSPLGVTPASIDFGDLPFWDEVTFRYVDPQAHAVYLLGDFTHWQHQPIPMARDRTEFTVTLALGDGRYRYRFCVDGRDVLDPNGPPLLSVTSHGIASSLHLQRWQYALHLVNHSRRRLSLKAHLSHDWIQVMPSDLTLPSRGEAQVVVQLQRTMMSLGRNEAWIEWRLQPKEQVQAKIAIRADLSQNGLVIRPHTQTIDLGTCIRGNETTIELLFDVEGNRSEPAPYTVLIYNHGDHTLHKFSLTATAGHENGVQRLTMPVSLTALPHHEQGTCRLSIDTQCHLWNRRFYDVLLHYRALFLRKHPLRLHFRRFHRQDIQQQRLRVWRSDGRQADLVFSLPERLQEIVTIEPWGRDTWQVMVHRTNIPASARIEDVIHVTDRASGSRDTIPIIIEVHV